MNAWQIRGPQLWIGGNLAEQNLNATTGGKGGLQLIKFLFTSSAEQSRSFVIALFDTERSFGVWPSKFIINSERIEYESLSDVPVDHRLREFCRMRYQGPSHCCNGTHSLRVEKDVVTADRAIARLVGTDQTCNQASDRFLFGRSRVDPLQIPRGMIPAGG